jgi:H/ACA ribonucleoprotein complex subunit 4
MISGFINIDKPKGPTSHDVCMFVRRILKTDKVGHSGTLDPEVTGVLPIAVGKATRFLRYLEHDKEYVGVMHLHEDIDEKKLRQGIKEFTGKIKQIPPIKSRVKRQEREREIYSFEILEIQRKDVLFRVHCEAGTYIRKLIHDLGQKLEIGAHMTELRRINAGNFAEKDSITLYQLNELANNNKLNEVLMPVEIIAEKMPKIEVKEEFLEKLYHGSPIYGEYIKKQDKLEKDKFAAVFCNKKFVEVAKIILDKNKIAAPETVMLD